MFVLERKSDKKIFVYPGRLAFFLVVLTLFMVSGCQTTKVDKWKPVRNEHKNQVHTVKWPGETLPAISKWYTGTDKNWKKIANANPNILPGKLNLGDRIFIPSTLLKTRAEMSKIFLEEWRNTANQRKIAPRLKKKGGSAPLLVPKLHKLKQDDSDASEAATPPDLSEPEDDGNDLELFGPK